ncbi:MAG: CoA ester lyase [Burkholderiales bacterium]|nr:CoA ester lyase [Burkholderiales bacterium]
MTISPQAALYGSQTPLPALSPCVHYAGSERFIRKALALQAELGPVFDIACDCEDGAPIGAERAHAALMAGLIGGADNLHGRVGARVHDIHHPAWQAEVDVLLDGAGDRIAFLTLPKAERAADVERFLAHVADRVAQIGLKRAIPVSVLIETPGAVHDAWAIAALPGIVSLDFGLMDFVSAHHGAIPATAMVSPGQFDHPLVRRAKCEIAAAALAHGIVPAHSVTRALDDAKLVFADARRARDEFGYLRMWSIHPAQIQPIVEAMRPELIEVEQAQATLFAAQDAAWAPLRIDGELHDRASYRHAWITLSRAHAAGVPLAPRAAAFFGHPAS